MNAIVLNAGQGRRLRPLTETTPKCLLPVAGAATVLDRQLAALGSCGIARAKVMLGFGADAVDAHLDRAPAPDLDVETAYNPFFETSDNLVTAWLARGEMRDDFVLLNGDSLFDDEVLRRLLASPPAPVTLAISRKARYDDDDMKVALSGTALRGVGKHLAREAVDAESIGLLRFQGEGARAFADALGAAVREPGASRAWYPSVVDALSAEIAIATTDVSDLWWDEIDDANDLARVRAALTRGDCATERA